MPFLEKHNFEQTINLKITFKFFMTGMEVG